MESELMTILEQIERDKGIAKEVLIEAVEAAVASAARKVWTVGKEEDVTAKLDLKTGKIQAFANGQEIRSSEFGRIAAQTAKQVAQELSAGDAFAARHAPMQCSEPTPPC